MTQNTEQQPPQPPARQGQELKPGIGERDFLKVLQVLSAAPEISPELMENFMALVSQSPQTERGGPYRPMMVLPHEREFDVTATLEDDDGNIETLKITFQVAKLSTAEIMYFGPRVVDAAQYVFHDWQILLTQGLDWANLLSVIFERALWEQSAEGPSKFSRQVVNDFFRAVRIAPQSRKDFLRIASNYAGQELTFKAIREETELGGLFLLSAAAEEVWAGFQLFLGLNSFFTGNIASGATGPTKKAISSLAGKATETIGKIETLSGMKSSERNLNLANIVPHTG